MTKENVPPRWLRVGEAAERLSVSKTTIYRCLRSGELEGTKVRGAVRVDGDDLERMTRRRRYADLACQAGFPFGIRRMVRAHSTWGSLR